ncbi:MAG: Trk system potassium uptake protein TrkH [Minwuia thermotolerans]|nr:MAG: Trk system potassium uptake protein TrkH [Minwuia thermotolerans]
MALTAVIAIFGWSTVIFAAAMLLPIPVALFYGETGTPFIFLVSALLTAMVGGALTVVSLGSTHRRTGRREAFLLAVMIWVMLPVFGALPFLAVAEPLDAFLESMSGLTTTGFSVFDAPEVLPRSLLFWRAELQWMGGLATIMLAVVLLGLFGLGGLAVYRSAIPAGDSTALSGRLKDTLSAIWWVYGIMTLVCALLLWLSGVRPFDALCYAMSTISTGGFVTSSEGVAGFSSIGMAILVVFMWGSALNFTLHWAACHGRWRVYYADPEFRAFGRLCLISAALIALVHASVTGGDPLASIGAALFSVASVASTTGFVGLSMESGVIDVPWPTGVSVVLLTLMMIGGAAGSTAGGFKLMRFALLIRQGGAELARLSFPSGIKLVTYGGYRVESAVLRSAWNYVILFAISVAVLALLIDLDGHDLPTALALSIGAMSNAGQAATYVTVEAISIVSLDPVSKIGIVIGMLAGRLELLALIGLFMPSFWGR